MLETIRAAAREQVAKSSLRHVAQAAGVKVATAKNFIDGAAPYERNAARWKRWYLRLVRGEEDETPVEDDAGDLVHWRLRSAGRVFPSDAELAAALGVDRAQPARWRSGQAPDRDNWDRIVGLDVVVELLSGYLSPSSIPKWLNGVNAHLGNRRPIAVMRDGNLSEVIAAIEAEKSGAFA